MSFTLKHFSKKWRTLFITVASLLIIISTCLIILWFLLVDTSPSLPIKQTGAVDTSLLKQAESLLNTIHHKLGQQSVSRLILSQAEISALLAHGLSQLQKRQTPRGISIHGSSVDITPHTVTINLSFSLNTQANRFLNLSVVIAIHESKPVIQSVNAGSITLPAQWLRFIWQDMILPRLPEKQIEAWQLMTDTVQSFKSNNGQLQLVYQSDASIRERLKHQAEAVMVGSQEDRDTINLYLQLISAIATMDDAQSLQLSHLFKMLFSLAKARSEVSSAVRENRLLIKSLGIQVAKPSIRALIAPSIAPSEIRQLIVLKNRHDLTLHFLVSAALALELDETTVLDIGIGKEQLDASTNGNGFSFVDLLADIAGIRLTSNAIRNEESARNIQTIMSQIQDDSSFMPSIDGLPEGLSSEGYGDILEHPMYSEITNRINKRLDQLPVLRQP
ncbi:hypothetical protein CI610_00109 [invertebrate metagenome]|uniref:Uncharacterized protein n=1 Tax=invertebrate metagenome TaxID=1711999 RepID=A0A2H9TC86_9ZZZZ